MLAELKITPSARYSPSTTLFRDTVNSMTREKFREMTMSLSAVSSRRQVPVLSSTLPRSSIRLDTR